MKERCCRVNCDKDATHFGSYGMAPADFCDEHHAENMEYQKTHFAYMDFHGELQKTHPEIHKLFWGGNHWAVPGKVTIEISGSKIKKLRETAEVWLPLLKSYLPDGTEIVLVKGSQKLSKNNQAFL